MSYKIELKRVEFIPKVVDNSILYLSDRFQVAVHNCACGCGNKVVTPLGPTEWKFTEKACKPSLYPSIGNWQLPCKSHYWIRNGEIKWSHQWSDKMIEAGRRRDQQRLEEYYSQKSKSPKKSFWKCFKNWIHPNK